MTRLYPAGVPLTVTIDKAGRPRRFVLQGRPHHIQQIRQRWQVDTEWWQERIWRAYFAVTTAEGLLCVLYYDLAADAWYLSKLYD